MNQQEIDDTEWSNHANWRFDMFYFSRRDSRAFVPKRRQWMGVTINFARPVGIILLAGVIGFAIVVTWLSYSNTHNG